MMFDYVVEKVHGFMHNKAIDTFLIGPKQTVST